MTYRQHWLWDSDGRMAEHHEWINRALRLDKCKCPEGWPVPCGEPGCDGKAHLEDVWGDGTSWVIGCDTCCAVVDDDD